MPPLRGSVGLALVLHSFSDEGSEAALHGCRPYPRKSAFAEPMARQGLRTSAVRLSLLIRIPWCPFAVPLRVVGPLREIFACR